MPEAIDEICKAIGDTKILFWVCPYGCNGSVIWDKTVPKPVATCMVCGATSDKEEISKRQDGTLIG
jgi:hypothetical protein